VHSRANTSTCTEIKVDLLFWIGTSDVNTCLLRVTQVSIWDEVVGIFPALRIKMKGIMVDCDYCPGGYEIVFVNNVGGCIMRGSDTKELAP